MVVSSFTRIAAALPSGLLSSMVPTPAAKSGGTAICSPDRTSTALAAALSPMSLLLTKLTRHVAAVSLTNDAREETVTRGAAPGLACAM